MKPGTRLEHYEIGAPIGEGGMGTVYRAEDTRLKRTVAIKVLPPELAADPERLARLEREAQLLATMSHPNVATVHGFGHETVLEDGRERPVTFLVMELVPGPSLHDRIAEGPLQWREAVEVAIGIAAGLEAAHERGIVHRDLKPANVHVGEEEGSARSDVKVLDFGLAKAFEGDDASGSLELSASPTVAAATRTGMILGTASYMSPEQARGKAVDKRADIWALGCVLFEMLTGKKAFAGETVSDVLASILKEEPDLGSLPAVPIRLRHLLERCLAKHPNQRMRDVGDVRLELETAREEKVESGASVVAAGASPLLIAGVAAAALVLGLGAGLFFRGAEAPRQERRFLVSPDAIASGPDALEISPDGRWLAEVGGNEVRLRALDDYNWRSLEDTANVESLTFSTDSRRLYMTQGVDGEPTQLVSVGLDGTTPTTEAELGTGLGLVFRGLDGSIMASLSMPNREYVIYRLEPSGALTELARGPQTGAYIIKDQLAENRWLGWHFDFAGNLVQGLVVVGAGLEEGVPLLEGYRTPTALGDGRILAVDGRGRLVEARIDPADGQILEPPGIRLEGLGLASSFAGAYSLTPDGTLYYMAGAAAQVSIDQTLSWLDREGDLTPISARGGRYQVDSRVSPDGERLALEVESGADGATVSIWVHELDRDVQTALTPGQQSSFPVWSPDSTEIVFWAAGNSPGLYRVPVDRSAAPEPLIETDEGSFALPVDWSPDGSMLLYIDSTSATRNRQAERNDLWLLPAVGGEPRPFVNSGASEIDGRFSPDGRWIAYVSDQAGRYEVYIRGLEGGAEYRVSADGGGSPEWNPAGGEIFFARDGGLMVVEIDTSGATPIVGAERPLTRFPVELRSDLWHPHPDGQRFLVAAYGQDLSGNTEERSIRAILDWAALAAR